MQTKNKEKPKVQWIGNYSLQKLDKPDQHFIIDRNLLTDHMQRRGGGNRRTAADKDQLTQNHQPSSIL